MKLVIVIIHGIGTQTHNYADSFIEKLKESYEKSGNSAKTDLLFVPVYWQDILSKAENLLTTKITSLKLRLLRSFLIKFLADALVYQPTDEANNVYKQIHKRLEYNFRHIYSNTPLHTPILIIAHSLGTVIMSNFIWDCQNASSDGAKILNLGMEAIAVSNRISGIVTMGSPLAVWSLRFPNGGDPIAFPGETGLTTGKWLNIFSPFDVIGYPLKVINNQYYSKENIFDIKLKVGNILTFWNPACHTAYWDSKKVINMITNLIFEMVSSTCVEKGG